MEPSKCYVHPDRHGRGTAWELMQASLDWGAESGAAGVWLAVNSENARAVRFYLPGGG